MSRKWAAALPTIRALAGSVPADQIAERIGTTTNNLHKICHRNGISLPRPEEYRKHYPPLEEMAQVLRANGYSVEKRH